MSGLAKILLKNGARVSGSDMEGGFVVNRLNKLGADIKVGHNSRWVEELGSNLNGGSIVISAAIKEHNPELKLARDKGFKIVKYAQMLGEVMDSYNGIAIAGTHGKSTASGWLSYTMSAVNGAPSYIVGADIPQLEGSSGVGESSYFIAESCEYDRSFLNLRPKLAVVLNIEQDHLDYYRDEDDIIDAFATFVQNVHSDGAVIVNADDSNLDKMKSRSGWQGRWIGFGVGENADYRAVDLAIVNGCFTYELLVNGRSYGRVELGIPGRHNVYNSLAVIASGSEAGVDTLEMARAIGGFAGVDRRLMVKAQMDGIKILDDYAHHPTEIRASLSAIRERFEPERLICIFQPHQYSRTRFLLDDFAESFKLADIIIVPEIYFVRDTLESKEQVNAQLLVDRIRENGSEAYFIDSFPGICEYLKEQADIGDVIVTMGAGDIWKVADEYIQWLRRDS